MKDFHVLVVAPHPDDETLGCAGTLLKLKSAGAHLHWLIVTGMSRSSGFNDDQITQRKLDIEKIRNAYGFATVHELDLPPANLDILPKQKIVGLISNVIQQIRPSQVYTVYRNDAHSDHEVVYDAVMAATKTFRYPFIKSLLAYETISETDFGMKPEDRGFRPNIFVNIEEYLAKKIEILNIFATEIGEFPFPRSSEAVKALAMIRGVQCNAQAAEAFMLIKEIK